MIKTHGSQNTELSIYVYISISAQCQSLAITSNLSSLICYRWLRNLKVHGMCIVEGVPTVPETVIPVSYFFI